ncbi:hypothetical protein QQ045_011351 [Rhodiola kirilowii]
MRIDPFSIVFLTAILASNLQIGSSQHSPPPYGNGYATFTPSVAVIIVVLITALFFLGFFSIYLRHCSDGSSARGGTVRPIAGRSRRNAARGLDATIIGTFPTFPYSEVKHLKIGKGALECAVCLNEFEDDETLRLLPKCDHVFHPECIDAWLSSHTTCPVCRANLSEASDTPVEPETEAVESVSIEVVDVEEVVVAADDGESVNRRASAKSMTFPRFPKSHSTGHSLVQPVENVDRFTLRLPDRARQELMTRALNRTTSLVVLPGETSSRRGFRTGGEGSSRGKSYIRLGSLDRPDRWVFSMAPPFLTRESSMKSEKPNRSSSGREGVTSKRFNLIGRLSFNRFGGSKNSEPGLVGNDSARPPLPPV